jgi:NAD(P)H-hydrate epimerase
MKTHILDLNSTYYGLEQRILMENAGNDISSTIASVLGKNKRIAVFCGLGNNGGDGSVAARFLSKDNIVSVFLAGKKREIKTQIALTNWNLLDLTSCNNEEFTFQDTACDIVIDALLGVGMIGELREPIKGIVQYINNLKEKGATVVSVDLPTGYGTSLSVNADLIISLNEKKLGDALLVDIGIPQKIENLTGPGDVKYLKKRRKDSHKGDNGRVLIVGGSERYHGAPIYAAAAASMLVDLVYVATPCVDIVKSYSPDFIVTDEILEYPYDAAVIGVGMGVKREALEVMKTLDRKVIDADGLKILKEDLDRAAGSILTPHRGEFEHLFGPLPTTLNEKIETVREKAETHDCTIILKGEVDIIADASGYKLNYTGNEGMTTGGTGDILAGLTAGFLSSNEAFQAACAASFVNGLAGDFVYEERGVYYTSSDLLAKISDALSFCENFGENNV